MDLCSTAKFDVVLEAPLQLIFIWFEMKRMSENDLVRECQLGKASSLNNISRYFNYISATLNYHECNHRV